MRTKLIKVLTLTLLNLGVVFSCSELFAQTVNQEIAKTHLRWNVFTTKENMIIEKKGKTLLLKTLNTDFFETLKKDLGSLKGKSKYISDISFKEPNENNNISTVEIKLADDRVDVFNFYRERDKKHVLDFWMEGSDEDALNASEESVKPVLKKEEKKVAKKTPPPMLKPEEPKKKVIQKVSTKKVKNPGYRDYRYGASFVWDYDSLGPELKESFDLRTKTPELFYPIQNREYTKSDQEAHLQLAVNLYRKKKYGLMYKSIKLFQEKYGADTEIDTVEYLKANAILRDNIAGGNLEPVKMAINMLSSIASRSKNYELQKAIYKYLLAYYKKNNENVEALTIAKRFYVSSKENFDYEESQYAAEAILHHLAELNQVDRIAEVVKEKTIAKILSKSKLYAYQIYVQHKLGNMDEALKIYEKAKPGLAKPVSPSILFNVAEAYFRQAKYEDAIRTFDEFITQHSYHHNASHARLRLALTFELMEKDIDQTIVLYKNAINRSQDSDVSVEARIRYAALRSIRKIKLSEADVENRAFLDFDENVKLNKDHKKLLWLTRLRAFIVDGSYNNALTYLAALPLTSLNKIDQRVFEADGAEVIYGIISKYFQESNFSKVVEYWGTYRNKYIRKVANDPYMNFIVGKSYLKLGLYENFEKLYSSFQKISSGPVRSFPLWIERQSNENSQEMLLELAIIKDLKLKNWDTAIKGIRSLTNLNNENNTSNYYRGYVFFSKKDYKNAAMNFETFLSNQKDQTIFDPKELAQLINMYADALYNLGEFSKFQKVTEAILADTSSYAPNNPFIKSMRERLGYLSIEITAGKLTAKNALIAEAKVKKFLKEYPQTDYKSRLTYLLGMALAKNNKRAEARKLFEGMLGDQEVPASIKELVRSELSLMAIKERTI